MDADIAPESGWQELDRGPRKALAARILAALEHHGVSYGVIRNPKRLLEEGRGDLDIWVPTKSIQPAISLIEREVEATGWWLLKRVQRPYVSSLYLYRPGHPASALTIDAFPAIRWLVADLLPESLLADSLVREANFWIVDPPVGALASCLHHLAWNARVPARYLETYLRVNAGEDLPYSMLVKRIATEPNPHWKSMRRRVLTSAVARSAIMHPIRTGEQALLTVASVVRSSPGKWIAFEGQGSDRYLTEIDRRLHDEHFLVGRWGSIRRIPKERVARTTWYARNVWLKRRLGAIVLSSGDLGHFQPDVRVSIGGSGWNAQADRIGNAPQGNDVDDLFRYLLAWLASECRTNIFDSPQSKGIIVGLTGLDGPGQQALIRQLESTANLQPAAHHHWHPPILPQTRDPLKTDTAQAKQGLGSLASFARLIRSWSQMQLQFATVVRRQKRAGFVVFVELSFLDAGVDPTQSGFRIPGWALRLAARISLKPQLLLNLLLPSSHAMAREGGPSGETEQRPQMRRTVLSRLVDTRTLDANATPMDLADRAMEIIDGARRAVDVG